jgi:tetratricopeptide (TPR) repeat protein
LAVDLRESIRLFRAAVDRDPSYVLAWAGMADSFNLLGYYCAAAPNEVFPEAKVAAERALEMDESLAQAHCSLAFTKLLYEWDWEGAEREFQRTFELNPGYATAHHWYAEFLAFRGRHEEAIEEAGRALDLDPVSPIINVLKGWAYYYAGRYEEAISQLSRTLDLDPGFAPAEFWLGLAQEQLGDHKAALETLQHAVVNSNRSSMMLAALGRLHAERGEREDEERILAELTEASEQTYVPSYYIAAIHSGAGRVDQTLEWLEKACRRRESWMVFLNVDPTWNAIRSEQRFAALVSEVGLDGVRSID